MTRTKTNRMKRTTGSRAEATPRAPFLPSYLPASCSAGRLSVAGFSDTVSTVGSRGPPGDPSTSPMPEHGYEDTFD